ncbi:MAG: triphosphoribosyl-dephospho-CoA synthetase [Gemmataceae bacterium]|nr:triphosphoribosyl-dephospho-CoA synthetase [Gemmataceae bacterium]
MWEACARKAGNVHPLASFESLHFTQFLTSAAAIAPVMQKAPSRPVGETILAAVQATRDLVGANTNLGIILLLTPLAAVENGLSLSSEITQVLQNLTSADAANAYQAIRLANPGGLGTVPQGDVRGQPPGSLLEAMRLAADRDLIARQYAFEFRDIFQDALPTLGGSLELTGSLEGSIIFTHLHLMSRYPDSLIERKRGKTEAEESAERAKEVLARQWPLKEAGWDEFRALDRWLREVGNQRNPGATADLVCATLFAALRLGQLSLPLRFPWTHGMERALRRAAPTV